jgi:hypothetical protein
VRFINRLKVFEKWLWSENPALIAISANDLFEEESAEQANSMRKCLTYSG